MGASECWGLDGNGFSSGQITEASADNNKSEQKYLFDHYFTGQE